MKKLERSHLKRLKEESYVLNTEEEKRIKGGCSLDEMGQGYWIGGNYYWYRTSECTCGSAGYYENGGNNTYTQEQFYNWQGTWYGGYVDGWGYVGPEVTVYGGYGEEGYISGEGGTSIDCAFLCLNYISPGKSAKQYEKEYEEWLQESGAPEELYKDKGLFYTDFKAVYESQAPGGTYTTNLGASGFTRGTAVAVINNNSHAVIIKEKQIDTNGKVYYWGVDPQQDKDNNGKPDTVMIAPEQINQAYICN